MVGFCYQGKVQHCPRICHPKFNKFSRIRSIRSPGCGGINAITRVGWWTAVRPPRWSLIGWWKPRSFRKKPCSSAFFGNVHWFKGGGNDDSKLWVSCWAVVTFVPFHFFFPAIKLHILIEMPEVCTSLLSHLCACGDWRSDCASVHAGQIGNKGLSPPFGGSRDLFLCFFILNRHYFISIWCVVFWEFASKLIVFLCFLVMQKGVTIDIGRDVWHRHLASGCCIWCRLYSRCPLQRWPEVGHLIREKFSSRQQKTPPTVDEADEKYLNSTTICLYSFCSPYATWTARIVLFDDYNIHLP